MDTWLASVPSAHDLQRIDVAKSLIRAVHYASDSEVPGDVVEFGTASGFSASVLARALCELPGCSERRLWLFDSFVGLPEAQSQIDINSPHVESGVWGAGTCRGLSVEQLRALVGRLFPSDRLVIEAAQVLVVEEPPRVIGLGEKQ